MAPIRIYAVVLFALILGACATKPIGSSSEVSGGAPTAAARELLLATTQWQIVAVHNGSQAPAKVLGGTTLSLAFDANGRASGQSGCNRFSAAYTQDGRNLRFTQAAGTRMFCAQPEGVMAQEAQVLAALSKVAQWRVESDRLVLLSDSGDIAMALVRAVAP